MMTLWLKTLRVRFALWVAGLLTAVLVIFGVFAYLSLERSLSATIDDSLQLNATQAITTVEIENNELDFRNSLPADASPLTFERDLTFRYLDSHGQILRALGDFADWPVTDASLVVAQEHDVVFETIIGPNGTTARFYTAPLLQDDQLIAIVQVAQDLEDMHRTLRHLWERLLLGGGLLVLMSAGGGYFLVARALAPIDHITQAARQIVDGHDLSARLNLAATHDEVSRLGATLDEMLVRLEAAFQHERQFIADASHELRTPLAAMHTILSVIRTQRRTPAEYEQALTDLADETDRLRNLADELLQLARADANLDTRSTQLPVDISTLLEALVESLRPLAEAKGLGLTGAVPGGLKVLGDGDALLRLFVNLVDNAIHYTEHGSVTLSATQISKQIQIAITDTGQGIAPEHLPHVFRRFYRAEASRSSRGAGLGLALAQNIAHAHGGSITVNSVLGQGSKFVVTLPVL